MTPDEAAAVAIGVVFVVVCLTLITVSVVSIAYRMRGDK